MSSFKCVIILFVNKHESTIVFLFSQYRCYVEECKSVFARAQNRRAHCIQDHQFPHDFRFDVSRKQEAKHNKLKHNKQSVMEVDSCPGDKKFEMRVKGSKSKPIEPVAVLCQSSEQLGCGNVAKYEEGGALGQATCANQSGEDMHAERSGQPFSFIRGRGRYQRLGGFCKDLNSGINKREHTSHSNIWGTSGLLNALQDAEVCNDSEFTPTSDVVGDVGNEHEQISHMMDS